MTANRPLVYKGKRKQGQGHASWSSVKVTDLIVKSARCLLLLNNLKKFENDAIARFCCIDEQLKKWGQNTTKTGTITILTESTSRSTTIVTVTSDSN